MTQLSVFELRSRLSDLTIDNQSLGFVMVYCGLGLALQFS